MSVIRIESLSDYSDCETCGSSYAEGYRVYRDGEIILDLEPFAACFDGTEYTIKSLFRELLPLLGNYQLDTTNDPI